MATVAMSSFGKNGRFGNQLFQYAFLKLYSEAYGLTLELPAWPEGEFLFGISEQPLTQPLPEKRVLHENWLERLGDGLPEGAGFDLWGYFQYHSRFYAPYRAYIQKLFSLTPEIHPVFSSSLTQLRQNHTLVALHIRRGDFQDDLVYLSPTAERTYLEWLEEIWPTLESPILYVATDDPQSVAPQFSNYSPLLAPDLGISCPKAPFFIDFFTLCHADILAISNSTFSFFASLLNQTARGYYRPTPNGRQLVAYDPWNSPPLWYDSTPEAQSANAAEVVRRLVQALRETPMNRPDLIVEICKALIMASEFGIAQTQLTRVTFFFPTYQPAFSLLGQVLARNNQPQAAQKALVRALELDPMDVNARYYWDSLPDK